MTPKSILKVLLGSIFLTVGILFLRFHLAKPQPFFVCLNVQPSEIQNIQLLYGQAEIPMEESTKRRLFESLAGAKRCEEKAEPEGFRPSEYMIRIVTKQETYELVFYWFSGKRLLENGLWEYTDRRFDVEVGGEYISFEQAEDVYWNEALCEQALQKAIQQGKMEERYELDGYDGKGTLYDMGELEGLAELDKTPAEIMSAAETIVIGRFTGSFTEDDNGYQNPVFQVEEIWKAAGEPAAEITLQMKPFGKRTHGGKTYMCYPPIEQPVFIPGECYLLCLHYVDDTYQLSGGICGSARIWQQTTYPRYNTETHPFYKQNLAELKKQCLKDKRSYS